MLFENAFGPISLEIGLECSLFNRMKFADEITPAEEARYSELQQIALDAARQGDAARLVSMLGAGLPVNLADEKGNSLLMLACYHGHQELAKILLVRGAEPDRRNHRNQTPLAGVAFKGDLELVKLLVEHGADPHADQGGGRYPIQFAAMFGHPRVVEYLNALNARRPSTSWKILALLTGALRKTASFLRRLDSRVPGDIARKAK